MQREEWDYTVITKKSLKQAASWSKHYLFPLCLK